MKISSYASSKHRCMRHENIFIYILKIYSYVSSKYIWMLPQINSVPKVLNPVIRNTTNDSHLTWILTWKFPINPDLSVYATDWSFLDLTFPTLLRLIPILRGNMEHLSCIWQVHFVLDWSLNMLLLKMKKLSPNAGSSDVIYGFHVFYYEWPRDV